MPSAFPAMKVRAFLALLAAEPLGYRIVTQTGSHRVMEAPNRRSLVVAFHGREIPGYLVRRILVVDVGLSVEEALEVIRGA
jgi:predicted RNA binding protein YcfA (HicA-like mRNA interferase family)